ncbi:MAG: hypothetical protein IKK34_02385 [Clostridia bacterium]|nr:hypothetical protein [Clostridia bacterium]
MPTENPRITITVSPEIRDQLHEYQHVYRMKNLTQTIVSLIEKGLGRTEDQENQKSPALTGAENLFIQKYRTLDKHGREMVDMVLDKEIERILTAPSVSPVIGFDLFRIYEQRASAGVGIYLGAEGYRTYKVRKNALPRKAAFGVILDGDSMEPKYPDQSIVIISKEPPEIGQAGLYTMGEFGYVKIRGDGELISINKNYAPMPMKQGTEFKGKVIGILDPSAIIEEIDEYTE